jgi:uncharacterized protein YbcV (DUF1398 family)
MPVNIAKEQVVIDEDWANDLPSLDKKHFLLSTTYNDNTIIFCVKELDWQTAMNIDMKSFKTKDTNDYYSEEYERRQTLSKAIVWVSDSKSKIVLENKDETILESINYEIIDDIWNKYKIETNITAQEAQNIYESTKKYLNGQAQEGVPIPSIIPVTIAICDGWCTLNTQELRELTAGDWERMQIIKMARTDLMGIYKTSQDSQTTSAESLIKKDESPISQNSALDAWANRFPANHPNKPI